MRAEPSIDTRFARVMAHPLRQLLIYEYSVAVTSPSRLAERLGERVNLVSYHTGVLLRSACIELVRTERRRGATEHFYRATVPGGIEDVDWDGLPLPIRRVLVRRLLEVMWRDATDALPYGGMDDVTAHVSRTLLRLDEQGLEELAVLLRTTLDEAQRIETASRARNARDAVAELVILRFTPASAPQAGDGAA